MADPEKGHKPHPSEELEFVTSVLNTPISPVTFASPTTPRATFTAPTSPQTAFSEKPRSPLALHDSNDAGSDDSNGDHAISSGTDLSLAKLDQFSVQRKMSDNIADYHDLVQSSKLAGDKERNMTVREGLKVYPKAICWSVMLSMTLVMEGYDLNIINGFFALPQFKKRYGNYIGNGNYSISSPWQSGLTNGAVTGEILGLLFNGYLTEYFGYRRCLMGALVWLCCCIFLAFFAFHISMLLASEILCGLAWGVFQTLSTTYAAEVMPVALRAYLTSNVNLCWLIGQLIGSGVLRGTYQWQNEWSYRVPFGLQWMWALPILVGTYFAPESPWWLVRHEKYDEAKRNLRRLTSNQGAINEEETINMMRHTNELEKYISAGTSYWDCFKGIDLRRTEIVCMVWMIQTLSGSPMTGYSTYFFTRAGLPDAKAFDLSIGMYGLAIIAHISALFMMRYIGRRKLYLAGCGLMSITLVAAGVVGSIPITNGQSWTLGGLIVLMTFIYDSTIGPVCYSLVSELSSTRLRIKAVVLARVAYNLVGIVSNILMPYMLNPESWNLRGKTCYVWAFTAFLSMIWCWFRLPEPKGLTYLEIDIFFQKKVKARKFSKLRVELANTGYFSLVENETDRKGWAGYK